MCAIAGIFSRNVDARSFRDRLVTANNLMDHRGPDGEGYFFDRYVGLANRRLAIIDLTSGSQPVYNETKDIIAVFNGEIYNYIELRKNLEKHGHKFDSQGDTEVLVHLYEEKKERLLQDLIGMFAFVIYDANKKSLLIARDHFGIKPIYFTENSGSFFFSSEIKAILYLSGLKPELNNLSLLDYLTFQYIPNDRTLFDHIYKVMPGEMILVNKQQTVRKKYWAINSNKQIMSENEYLDNFCKLFKNSVSLQLRSDVPVGFHLSGGVDTAAVVGAAKSIYPDNQVLTFSCNVPGYESKTDEYYAEFSSKYFHTDHHINHLDSTNFLSNLQKIIWYLDEPLGDPGVVPQFLTNQTAKKYVKVILTGHGSDETLGGYARHSLFYLDTAIKDTIYGYKNCSLTLGDITPGLPFLKSYETLNSRFFSGTFTDQPSERYLSLIIRTKNARELLNKKILTSVKDYDPVKKVIKVFQGISGNGDILDNVLWFDLNIMLPPLLQMEDRAGMANSLESRLPYLDHRLVEFAFKTPTKIKLSGGNLKYLVREGLRGFLPPVIRKRKEKIGRPVPLFQWLKQKKFRKEVSGLLFSKKSRIQEFFNLDKTQEIFDKNQPFDRTIWGLLCLEIWMRTYLK